MTGGVRLAWNVVVIILLAFLAGGCATPRKGQEGQITALKHHIGLLESELDRKDQEIRRLEDELERTQEVSAWPKGKEIKSREDATPLSIKQIQVASKAAGFYKGPIDGKMGPKTKEAIKAFQKANGLRADGIVGRKTRLKLGKYLNR